MVKKDEPVDTFGYNRWIDRTLLMGGDGINIVSGSNPIPVQNNDNTYDVLIATDSTDSNITYIGKASKGSLTSSDVWQIKIIDKSSGVSITFKGDVDTFTQEWDEREA